MHSASLKARNERRQRILEDGFVVLYGQKDENVTGSNKGCNAVNNLILVEEAISSESIGDNGSLAGKILEASTINVVAVQVHMHYDVALIVVVLNVLVALVVGATDHNVGGWFLGKVFECLTQLLHSLGTNNLLDFFWNHVDAKVVRNVCLGGPFDPLRSRVTKSLLERTFSELDQRVAVRARQDVGNFLVFSVKASVQLLYLLIDVFLRRQTFVQAVLA